MRILRVLWFSGCIFCVYIWLKTYSANLQEIRINIQNQPPTVAKITESQMFSRKYVYNLPNPLGYILPTVQPIEISWMPML